MKSLLPLLFLLASVLLSAQEEPFRKTVLENGLTVITFRNTDAPRIMTYTVVRAGSVNDPANSTGLAHYFEHMMFKGTKRIAALDWEKEKPLLEKTAELFEQYRLEKDSEKRKQIYREIDRISGQAAKYANDEYWQLVRQMGAAGTNAFTSHEITAYENDIPSRMLDRFLALEAERFSNIALRRFHTELETVYEEFNRGQDSADRRQFSAMTELLYGKNTPYGRPVIGLPEHLKNPSIRDVETFFQTYYVPENMAVILAGDLDHDAALESVKKTFGKLKNSGKERTAVRRPVPASSPFATIYSKENERLLMAFRFPKNRETDYLFDLLLSVLQNGRCGLLDDLNRRGAVLSAAAGSWGNQFDNILILSAEPKADQTLEELCGLLLEEIGKIKGGDFEPSILKAVANNDRLEIMKRLEKRSAAADIALSLFQQNLTMADVYEDLEKADAATVKMLAEYAEKNLNQPVTVFRKSGKPAGIIHAEKPPITPVALSSQPSPFAAELAQIPAGKMPEVTVPDFSLLKQESGNRYLIRNDVNERFSLTLHIPVGTYHDPALQPMFDYVMRTGTEKHSPAEFNQKLYELALTVSHTVSPYDCTITVGGLQKYFPEAMALLRERLTQSKADPAIWSAVTEQIRTDRANAKKSPEALSDAALMCALYGNDKTNNPLFCVVPSNELKKMTAQEMTDRFHAEILSRSPSIVYFGPDPDAARPVIEQNLSVSVPLREPDAVRTFRIRPPEQNTVYTLSLPTTQITAYLVRNDEIIVPAETAFARLLSCYSGRLFFRELREKQSFGYIAGAGFVTPSLFPENHSFFFAVVGTQPDKLTDAMNGMKKLTDCLPEDSALFPASKQNILDQYRSLRIKPEYLFDYKKELERLRRPPDLVRQDFEKTEKMTEPEFYRATEKKLKHSKDLWILCGKTDGALTDFGTVIPLTPDDVLPE